MKISVFLIIVAFLPLTACTVTKEVSIVTLRPDKPMKLSRSEIGRLRRMASSGSAESAWKLSQYYGFSEWNEREHDRWLRRSAELGYPGAADILRSLKDVP